MFNQFLSDVIRYMNVSAVQHEIEFDLQKKLRDISNIISSSGEVYPLLPPAGLIWVLQEDETAIILLINLIIYDIKMFKRF